MGPFSLVGYLTECDAEIFGKKLFEEKVVESVLHRLDRLTQDEARITAAEILNVVYNLAQNMNAVMDGEQTRSASSTIC